MIDLHSHILPGIDDGPRSLEESLELARTVLAVGTTTLAATPHVRADYPTRPEQMEEGVAQLALELRFAGIPLEVIHGGELELETLATLDRDTIMRFTIGQRGRHLLVEFPYLGWPTSLEGVVYSLGELGITPILAHPERNPDIQNHPESLAAATEMGALVQVTTASILGSFGRGARKAVSKLADLGLINLVASDVHHPHGREPGLAAAGARLSGGALARYLTEEAPRAIALGLTVPPPPQRKASHRPRIRLRVGGGAS